MSQLARTYRDCDVTVHLCLLYTAQHSSTVMLHLVGLFLSHCTGIFANNLKKIELNNSSNIIRLHLTVPTYDNPYN